MVVLWRRYTAIPYTITCPWDRVLVTGAYLLLFQCECDCICQNHNAALLSRFLQIFSVFVTRGRPVMTGSGWKTKQYSGTISKQVGKNECFCRSPEFMAVDCETMCRYHLGIITTTFDTGTEET